MKRLPWSLVIVAVLFILWGLSALVDVVMALARGNISINFGVLGPFIGLGLLRLSRPWRTCALVMLWIAMIAVPIVGILFLFVTGPLNVSFLGQRVGSVGKGVGAMIFVLAFAFFAWQYWVLTRPDVRRLFNLPGAWAEGPPNGA